MIPGEINRLYWGIKKEKILGQIAKPTKSNKYVWITLHVNDLV